MELFANGFVAGDLLFPAGPVFLLLVDVMFEDSVAVGEHWFNVSKNVVDFASTSLIDGGADGPNKTEYKPLFNVEEVVSSILLFALLKAEHEGVVQVAEALDAGSLRSDYHLSAVSTLHCQYLEEILGEPLF